MFECRWLKATTLRSGPTPFKFHAKHNKSVLRQHDNSILTWYDAYILWLRISFVLVLYSLKVAVVTCNHACIKVLTMLSKFQFTYHYAESGGAALTRLNLESTQYSMHFFFWVLENHHHHSATAQKEILTCAIYESAPDHRLFILFGSLGIGKMVFFFFFFVVPIR